jgi:uncharacterized protein YkwD
MTWASRQTSEMPFAGRPPDGGPRSPGPVPRQQWTPADSISGGRPQPGRHRRRGPNRAGIAAAAFLLVLAVTGAMFSPVLLGWPPPDGAAPAPSIVVAPDGAAAPPPVRASPDREPATTAPPTTTTRPPTKKPTSRPPEPTGLTAFENRVVELTNEARAEEGCPRLRIDAKLRLAARRHSADMARNRYFSHTSRDGRSPGQRLAAAGFDARRGWAENIARGYPNAEAVMDGWMNSPGHRGNILNCGLRTIGVGAVRAGGGQLYWTQDFGG